MDCSDIDAKDDDQDTENECGNMEAQNIFDPFAMSQPLLTPAMTLIM